MSFAEPASASGIAYETLLGDLLIVDVTDLVKDITTDYGTKDAIRATITVLDSDLAGATYEDVLVFPKVLQSQLRPNMGRRVLGRLSQGEAKKGQKPPWKLTQATDEDKEAAAKFMASQLTADDI